MTAVVRIDIHYNGGKVSTENDKVFLVVIFGKFVTKDAFLLQPSVLF